jgi:plastocyanin
MEKSNLFAVFVVLSFLLALSGCGEEEAAPAEEPAPETVAVTNESELPEEEVQEVPSEIVPEEPAAEQEAPAEEAPEEPAEEQPAEAPEEAAANESEAALTASTYSVVSLKDLNAYPEEMHVKVGTTVEWRNVNDNLQHIIGWNGQKQAGVKPEPIKQGESWSYTFTTPGKIVWFSTARPTIQGTIYVEE